MTKERTDESDAARTPADEIEALRHNAHLAFVLRRDDEAIAAYRRLFEEGSGSDKLKAASRLRKLLAIDTPPPQLSAELLAIQRRLWDLREASTDVLDFAWARPLEHLLFDEGFELDLRDGVDRHFWEHETAHIPGFAGEGFTTSWEREGILVWVGIHGFLWQHMSYIYKDGSYSIAFLVSDRKLFFTLAEDAPARSPLSGARLSAEERALAQAVCAHLRHDLDSARLLAEFRRLGFVERGVANAELNIGTIFEHTVARLVASRNGDRLQLVSFLGKQSEALLPLVADGRFVGERYALD